MRVDLVQNQPANFDPHLIQCRQTALNRVTWCLVATDQKEIRLDLLRLHAGSATVESVTTHLDLAAEVSAEVERLIAAHSEVADVLKFPRTPAATPV